MSEAKTRTAYIEPDVSPEQFVPDHIFLYTIKGAIRCYDGNKSRTLNPGEYYLFRKNRLLRYNKEKGDTQWDKVILRLEEPFLKKFQEKHQVKATKFKSADAYIKLKTSTLMPDFIHSLKPYYDHGKIAGPFAEVKQEELLIILLQNQPELAGILFDYGIPEKINLEEFMNRNYKFNVSIRRFAYLTGRSISAFKRDFKETFNATPNRWLVQKRLKEAHFLIKKKHKKPSEIYLDLGFESLSHFSFAFKKLFGINPTELSPPPPDKPSATPAPSSEKKTRNNSHPKNPIGPRSL